MKNILFFLPLVLSVSMLNGQVAFRHVTNASNTNGHITTLNHSQLNGNPNAMVFVASNYNNNGSDAEGTNYLQNAGTWYNGSRWTIFNQDTKAAMPLNMIFNILVAPPNHPNCFTITCTAASKAGLAPNGMVIDHPATNNKPDVLLLVSQNYADTYNDNSPIVSYSNGKWYISNNKYLLAPEISAKTTLPIGARFNVMVVENNSVPGFPNGQAFMHTANPSTIHAEQHHITFLDHPALNRNSDAMIWATPNWGWSPGRNAGQTSGPYNDSPIKVWYDHPNDRWNYKNGFWSVYNIDGTPIPDGAKFNVVTIEMNRVQPYAAFKHTATASTISGHETILEHTSLNNKADLILQVTPDYREVYNAASTGVRYDGSRWRVFNIDRSPMPPNIRFNVMAERADANHFIHVASAANTGNPNAGVTTIDHPALNDNPSAMLLVAQTPGTGNVYNNSEVAVWYTGKYWNIYNENQSNMPAGASFHVSILSPAAVASIHSSAPGNIWGQVPSATETDYADPQKLLFITHNGSQGDWNPDPCGLYYPPGRTSWSILTGNTARMLERRRFNVLVVNEIQPQENIWVDANVELFNPGSTNREVQTITTTLPFHSEPQEIMVEVVDGYVIYQGDIILGREDVFFDRENGMLIPKANNDGNQHKDAGIPGDQFRWLNGVIPFEIQANHPRQAQIWDAIRIFNERTNICFTPRTNEPDFVAFILGNGCSSPVGRDINARNPRTGAFDIIIGTNCSLGNIMHEMLHSAGMFHEQSRSDRDNFVRINAQNIQPGREPNFRQETATISICQYDLGSIMHYPANAFSRNNQPTIEPLRPLPVGVVMGQRTGLSDCDIRGVNALYPNATGCRISGGSAGGSAVIVYELPNFRGRSTTISNIGEFRSEFRIQSIRIPSGFWVALMDHSECISNYFSVTRDVLDMSAQFIYCGILLATPQTTNPSRDFELTIRTGGDGIRAGSQAIAEFFLRSGSTFSFPLNNGRTWNDNSTNTMRISLPSLVQPSDIQSFTLRFESTGNDWNADNWSMDFLSLIYVFDQAPGEGVMLVRWSGTPAVRFSKNEVRTHTALINPY